MIEKVSLDVVSVNAQERKIVLLDWNVIVRTKTFFTIITNKENKEAFNLALCKQKEHSVILNASPGLIHSCLCLQADAISVSPPSSVLFLSPCCLTAVSLHSLCADRGP